MTGNTNDLDLTGPSDFDAEINAAMIAIARGVVLAKDSAKFGCGCYVRVGPLSAVSLLWLGEHEVSNSS